MNRGISLAVLLFMLFPMVIAQAQTRPATTGIVIKMTIAQIAHDGSADATRLVSLVNHPPQSGPLPTTDPRESLSIAIVDTEISQTFEKLQNAGKVNVLARPFVTSKPDQLHTLILDPQGQVHLDYTSKPPPNIGTVSYVDVGLLVDMIPQIDPNGMIVILVVPGGGGEMHGPWRLNQPLLSKLSSSGRIVLSSGQTIVVSGIVHEDKTTNATSDVLIFMTLSLDP